MSATGPPRLSVIVCWQEGETPAPGILETLARRAARAPEPVDVVLVDGRRAVASSDGVPAGVRHLPAPGATSLPLLQARGLTATRGHLVALTEICVLPADDWVARCLDVAADEDVAAFGGVVEPAADLGALDLAAFLCDYGAFLPPLAPGPSDEMPGCNVVFQRRALEPTAGFAETGFWKSFHCRALLARGEALRLDPRLRVTHHRRFDAAGWAARRWRHGRCFGAMRRPALGALERVALALAAPLLPGVLAWRVARRVWPRRRFRRPLLATLPLVLAVHAAWVMGEWTGHVFGPGQSCRRV